MTGCTGTSLPLVSRRWASAPANLSEVDASVLDAPLNPLEGPGRIGESGTLRRGLRPIRWFISLRDRSVSLLLEHLMKKGEATRKRIVSRTADLLNTQGSLSTPVSEIMRVAGLQKGGIYRHFESRAALTREAFEFAIARMRDRLLEALAGKKTAADKLFALL